jgi:hypothetical protein
MPPPLMRQGKAPHSLRHTRRYLRDGRVFSDRRARRPPALPRSPHLAHHDRPRGENARPLQAAGAAGPAGPWPGDSSVKDHAQGGSDLRRAHVRLAPHRRQGRAKTGWMNLGHQQSPRPKRPCQATPARPPCTNGSRPCSRVRTPRVSVLSVQQRAQLLIANRSLPGSGSGSDNAPVSPCRTRGGLEVLSTRTPRQAQADEPRSTTAYGGLPPGRGSSRRPATCADARVVRPIHSAQWFDVRARLPAVGRTGGSRRCRSATRTIHRPPMRATSSSQQLEQAHGPRLYVTSQAVSAGARGSDGRLTVAHELNQPAERRITTYCNGHGLARAQR